MKVFNWGSSGVKDINEDTRISIEDLEKKVELLTMNMQDDYDPRVYYAKCANMYITQRFASRTLTSALANFYAADYSPPKWMVRSFHSTKWEEPTIEMYGGDLLAEVLKLKKEDDKLCAAQKRKNSGS
jgi:hypothetical protein